MERFAGLKSSSWVVVVGEVMSLDAAEEGFRQFVANSYERLVHSAFLLTGDRGYAEDLVQDALLRVYGRWSSLRAREAAYAYAHTTMVRAAGRWWRRSWHGEVSAGHFGEEPLAVSDVSVSLDVRRALAGLPWQQRAVVVLRFFDDLTEEDTARRLGCAVGTVKSRTSRALANLRVAGSLVCYPEDTTEVADA